MRGSRIFFKRVLARRPENSLDKVFFKSSTYFTVYRGGSMEWFYYRGMDPEGVQHFPGGGGQLIAGGSKCSFL